MCGGTRVIAIYAGRLRHRGHRVLVVSTPRRLPPMKRRVKSLLRGCGWPRISRNEPSHLDGVDVEHHVIDRWRPVTEADVPDADVVIATWWETSYWVAALPPNRGAKAYFVQDYGANPGQPLEKVVETWRLPLHKITISRWLLDLIEQHCGDLDVTYAPNSVDLELFCAPPRGKQDRPTVGLMYSTRRQKGLEIMLASIELARRVLPDLHAVAYGPSAPVREMLLPAGSEYTKLAPEHVLKEIYGKCDAWLFGSHLEGFGLPILEAMACRTPVIATPAGAAPELLAEGGGVLVSLGDAAAMARAIERVGALPDEKWRAMSDAAYRTATRYTWDDATDLFEAGLRTAIRKKECRGTC